MIEHQGPWHDADQVERAVVQWDGWYNTERLHSALDCLPPEEFEAAYRCPRSRGSFTAQLIRRDVPGRRASSPVGRCSR
ncbi:integrase core domain-containing protein [Streptomyces sp. AK010]|uniref:integrase core domain-containing protein n=1 Tax=Streptomyces sp. AK010 TaxID=2723074 RepID=UPI0037DA1AB0